MLCTVVPTTKSDDLLKPADMARAAPAADSGARREIAVGGVGVVTLAPDQCLMTIAVSSSKEEIQEATNSVKRRLDYVVQALKNHHVKDADMEIHRSVDRTDGKLYCCSSEVVVHFREAASCEAVHNLLVEKLDDSVRVSEPAFFCSLQARESGRCRAASLAVHNAKVKAADMARQLGEAVGESLVVREDSMEEKEGPASASVLAALAAGAEPAAGGHHRSSAYRRRALATVTITATVTVVFALKS